MINKNDLDAIEKAIAKHGTYHPEIIGDFDPMNNNKHRWNLLVWYAVTKGYDPELPTAISFFHGKTEPLIKAALTLIQLRHIKV